MEQTDTESEDVMWDSTTGTYTARYDWSGPMSPSIAISRTIARIEETDPLSLPPLHDAVDADAINGLVGRGGGSVRVSFEYERYNVSVSSTGTITVEPLGGR